MLDLEPNEINQRQEYWPWVDNLIISKENVYPIPDYIWSFVASGMKGSRFMNEKQIESFFLKQGSQFTAQQHRRIYAFHNTRPRGGIILESSG